MAPSDLIYSHTSLVAPSSAQPCNHSAPNVSKEQRDIKRNYDGFRRIKWTQGLGLLQISALAWQFHTHSRCPASKKNTKKKTNNEGKFPADVCALSGGGQRGIKYTGLRGRTQRIQGDRHSITDDNDSNSVLTAREQKARLSVALLPRSDSSSLTDTDGGTRSSWAEFNCGLWFSTETHC